jgi:hypothetical protein
MALGSYKIPKEFKDEDKWFKFFTKRQLIYAAAIIFIDVNVVKFTHLFHLEVLGIIVAILVTLILGGMAFITMPADKYLIGGGMSLESLILRLFLKYQPSNKKIYVKNYEKEQGV